MSKLQKTTGDIAKKLCQQITEHIGGEWSDNPAQWWSNIYNSSQTTNMFFTELMNTIIKQRIISESFENPLGKYKSGELPLGIGSQEIYMNPKTGRDFITKIDDETAPISNWEATGVGDDQKNRNYGLLYDSPIDMKTCWYRLNYGKQYKNTYSDLELRNVMTTWDSVGEFIDGVARNLWASAEIEEYEASMDVFANGYAQGFMSSTPITAITDKATAQAFLVKARAYYRHFLAPSTKYNAWSNQHPTAPIKTWSRPDGISIVLTPEAEAVVDVYALAEAFNMDKTEMIGKIIRVDRIDEAGEVQAILLDDKVIHFEGITNRTDAFFNSDTCKENLLLVRRNILSLSPFGNAVAFTTATFTLTASEPADWSTKYTNYFTKTGESYTPVPAGDAAPDWEANTYYAKS